MFLQVVISYQQNPAHDGPRSWEKMRNRKRTTVRKPLTEELLKEAQALMTRNGLSVREVAKSIGFDESTLRKRIKKGTASGKLGRFNPTFTPEQEIDIVEHLKALDQRMFGLTLRALRAMLYSYATKNKINHQFSDKNELAGRDFTRVFLKRNRLSLRTARKTSVARGMGFNRQQVNLFYDNLFAILNNFNFPQDRIFNMDETGVQTVPHKLPKHIAPTGKREVTKSVAAEQGQTVSIACAMNSAGYHIPPFFIFARKRKNPLLIKGGPAGCDMGVSDRGYMTSSVFVEYLNHFSKFSHPSLANPVLLILDNHVSHISLEAIKYAKSKHIHMLSLPPHCSHKMQPLDRTFFGPFKTFYDAAADSWTVNNPGQVLSIYDVAGLVNMAFQRAATVENAVQGFRATGIFPFDRHVFSNADFLPADVTDQDCRNSIEQEFGDLSHFVVFPTNDDTPGSNNNEDPKLTGPNHDDNDGNNDNVQDEENDVSQQENDGSARNTIGSPPVSHDINQPSTSSYVSPRDLVPLPKIKITRKRSGRGLKSIILTSTPHKERIEKEVEERERETIRKAEKSAARNKKAEERKKLHAEKLIKGKRQLFPAKFQKKIQESSSSLSESDYSVHNSSSDMDMDSEFFEEHPDSSDERQTAAVDSPQYQKGQFVVVKVHGKNKYSFRFYVAKIIQVYDGGIQGLFFKRVSNTACRFSGTSEDAFIENGDIYMKLSNPIHTSTSRFVNMITFEEDLSELTIF